ncbi:MAG: CHAT domain-containing protein [Candidatus Melainabacteria bacterium]|nr:MAG: CHAT domain-containing protein [Candidatus Melainabacteria bacterium]
MHLKFSSVILTSVLASLTLFSTAENSYASEQINSGDSPKNTAENTSQSTSPSSESDKDLETQLKEDADEAVKRYGAKSREATDAQFAYLKLLKNRGKNRKAEDLCRKVLSNYEKLCGNDSMEVADAEDVLGRILRHQYRYVEAELHQRKALDICKKLLPPTDPQIAAKMESLGKIMVAQGNVKEGRDTYQEAFDIATKSGDSNTADYIAGNLAACLVALGNTDEARKYITPLLNKITETQKSRPDSQAVLLALMGQSYAKEKKFDLAKKYYEEAIVVFKKFAPQHPALNTCYSFMADDEIVQGNYSVASKYLAQSIELAPNRTFDAFSRLAQQERLKFIDIYQPLIRSTDPKIANAKVLNEYLTLKTIEKHPHQNSAPLLESIYKARRQTFGDKSALTSEAALQLAVQLKYMSGHTQPLIGLAEPGILAFAQSLVNPKTKADAEAQVTIAVLGGRDRALDYVIEALLVLAEMKGEEEEFESAQKRLNLAEDCLKARNLTPETNSRNAHSPETLARKLLQLATVWLALGKYHRATELTESAIATISDGKTDSKLKYDAYLQLSNLNLAESDSEAALKNVSIAQAMALKLFGEKSIELIPCYRILSQIKLSTGQYKEAKNYAQEALRCTDLSTSDAIWMRNTTGFCDLAEGRYDSAKFELNQALNFCNDSVNNQAEDRSQFTASSTALAEALIHLGDKEEALQNLDWSLSTDHSNSDTYSLLSSARDCAGIAMVHSLNSEKELAATYALKAASFTDKFLQNGFSQLSFAQQCSFVNVTRQVRSILLNTCTDQEQLSKAYGYIIKWKGLLLETLRSQSAIASLANTSSGATKKSVSELADVRVKLGQMANTGQSQTSEFNLLTETKERLERNLSQITGAQTIADVLTNHDVQWFQSHLQPDQAFLDILTYTSIKDNTEHYALIALRAPAKDSVRSQQNGIYMLDLGQTREINDEISSWRNNITQQISTNNRDAKLSARDIHPDLESNQSLLSAEEYLQLTQKLAHHFILNPELAKFLGPDVTKLWLCPEAAMARTPWNSIGTICGATQFTICEVDSPREFIQITSQQSEPNKTNQLLLAGVGTFRSNDLNDLPGTAREINGIKSEASKAGIECKVLLDSQASKKNVEKKIDSFSVVHFSTHGFARSDSSAQSENRALPAIHFGLMSMMPSIARNPLTDSGLVLAPSEKTSGADEKTAELIASAETRPKWRSMPDSINASNKKLLTNLLTAEEIVGLNLKNCKLVSLSACKTGLGTGLDGQGVLGLRSAILAAGARSILMSLWSVDDEATEQLMQKFYSCLLDPQNPMTEVEALQKAQDYIRSQPQWQAPSYWAGWVIAGDGWQKIREKVPTGR